MSPEKLQQFLMFITRVRITRAEGESIIGRAELARLISEGKVSDNPFDNCLQRSGNTEDFYP